jgi:hypothetical protein
MNKQKVALVIIGLLVSIKFIFLPWTEWVTEIDSKSARLSSFDDKQQQVIANESLFTEKLALYQNELSTFVEKLPEIKSGDKANTLWFSLVDSLKVEGIQVYSQRVEFEEYVTEDLGYVTGTFYIKGNAENVMQVLLNLESKAPFAFLEQMRLIPSPKKKTDSLVTQLYLRYWFTKLNEAEGE